MYRQFILTLFILSIVISCTLFRYQLTPEAKNIHDNLSSYTNVERIELLKGTDYQTPAFVFTGNDTGTNILIIGGTHGNEPAGYETALRLVDRFYKKPPSKGKIIIVKTKSTRNTRIVRVVMPSHINIDSTAFMTTP